MWTSTSWPIPTVKFRIRRRCVAVIVASHGREEPESIRAALDALLDFGRPTDVELLVLIDRRLQRHLPIQAKYVGKVIDSIATEKVKVEP